MPFPHHECQVAVDFSRVLGLLAKEHLTTESRMFDSRTACPTDRVVAAEYLGLGRGVGAVAAVTELGHAGQLPGLPGSSDTHKHGPAWKGLR